MFCKYLSENDDCRANVLVAGDIANARRREAAAAAIIIYNIFFRVKLLSFFGK